MNNRNKIIEVLFLFILSLIPLIWFHDNTLLLGHDSGFRLDPSNQLHNLFYSWNSIFNFGTDWSIFKGFLVTQFPEFLFTSLTHSIFWGQRLTLIFWFFTMTVSMYIFINEFFKENKFWFFRLFASLFYVYNFFILQAWFIAERSKFSVYAALPLGFLIIYKILARKISIIRGAVFFSCIFFIFNGGGNIPVFGGLLLTYGIVFAYFIVETIYKKQICNILYIGKVAASLLFAAVFVNFYWFLPQVFLALSSYSTKLSANGGVAGILSWEGTISQNASLINLFRLQGVPDWYDISHPFSPYYFNNIFLIILSCIPFLIILLGFTLIDLRKNEKEYVYNLLKIISITFIVGFIFAGGTHPPLGFVYGWIITHVPGFAIFRSSYYKFSPTVFFSFSILVGYFIDALFRKYITNTRRFNLAGVLAIIILLGYNFPFFTINFFLFNKPFTTKIKLPTYTQQTFTYIHDHIDPQESILLAPELDPNIGQDSYSWGYWSLDILPRIALRNPILASDANTPIIKNLYQSLNTGDEELFIKLAEKAGVHYILWRDDVLYNDKITNGLSLKDEKKNLDSFSSLHEQFTAGAWKLYALPQPDSLFTSSSHLYRVHAENPNIADLITVAQEPVEKTSWITSWINKNANGQVGNIFISSCNACDTGYIGNQSQQLAIPSVRIIPWSKLYFFIQWKENRQLKQSAAYPNQRIDVDLSLSNKRISEIWQMGYKFFSQKTPYFSEINEKKYESLINDAITKANSLGNDDRIQYQGRIIAYLTYQKRYLEPTLQNDQIKPTIDHMLSFIDKKIATLNQQLWISSTNDDKKSYITIPMRGDYTVNVVSNVKSPFNLFIDNNEIDMTKRISLAAGNHTTEVKYPSLENLISIDSGNNSLEKDKPIAYDIHNFSCSSIYTIQYSYILPPKTKVVFSIYQNDQGNQLSGAQAYPLKTELIDDGEKHEFPYEYHPNRGVEKASMIFTSDKDTHLELSNFTIQQTTNPRIFLTQNASAQREADPKITYQKLNETKYIVSINNAKSAYLLNFNQSFSDGWEISSQSDEGLHAQHLEVNNYSNGWFIDKKGDYRLLIEYTPQNYFYLGVVISFITVGVCVIIILIRKNKNGK